ncbi:MAG: FAD-binding oxidoreductase [Prolixibacteraceae bacterium]
MEKTVHHLTEIEKLTPETFVLHFERKGLVFIPGQYVVLRDPGSGEGREYSIYSSLQDEDISFLVREIIGGSFSRFLTHLKPSSPMYIEGPAGFFILDEALKNGSPVLFVATGTGISPFRSFVRSFPGLNYMILHGVHFADEAYGKGAFNPTRYCLCTSREQKGDYFGRVTYYLKENPVDPNTICYLCGNSEMIDEVTGILENYHIPPEHIRTEVFF